MIDDKDLQLKDISRVEVIGRESREYIRYFKDNERIDYSIQDEGRTLKIFIEERK